MGHSTRRLMMGSAGAGDKTYVDDVYSTYLYYGNCPDGSPNTTNTITNGIDLDGEGGLVWCKHRTGLLGSAEHILVDTERGVNKYLSSDANTAEGTGNSVSAFNSNGFTLKGQGPGGGTNYGVGSTTTAQYTSWSFRKQKGFFDIVTWTQSGSDGAARTLDHNLGCVPGFIMLKQTTGTENWICWHRDLGTDQALQLNSTTAAFGDNNSSVNSVSSTQFVVGADNNKVGSYVAYLFAGGKSQAATASSTTFSGSGSTYLQMNSDAAADCSPGTGDFCLEAWIKPDTWGDGEGIYWADSGSIATQYYSSSGNFALKVGDNNNTILVQATAPKIGVWTHVAFTRSGTSLKMFLNGLEVASATNSTNLTGTGNVYIGWASGAFDGAISNLRFVKGSAVYTSSFNPPTKPLTNITNTKLLCCNSSSSATSATVAPATISSSGSVSASSASPFDDPECFQFGGDGDQNIVKCGSYSGDGNASNTINLGWEPQWFMIKRTDNSSWANWGIYDMMRGLPVDVSAAVHKSLLANTTALEAAEWTGPCPTPTGVKLNTNLTQINHNGGSYIYIAIRRPDGYVGKPAEAGTDAFAMDTGAGNSYIPNYDSGFPVDMSLRRQPGSSDSWVVGARLMNGRILETNDNDAEQNAGSNWAWDSNLGWSKEADNSTYQSWMWQRGEGFDVLAYDGNGTAGRQLPHNLAQVPEMIWCKNRSRVQSWHCYHKGLNGGTTPENWFVKLNDTQAEGEQTSVWNDTAPTSIVVTVGSDTAVNYNGDDHLMLLFSSVAGISKCGYYTGTGAAGNTQTTGFTPRLIIVKCVTDAVDWGVFDTLRGLGSSGNDKRLYLNNSSAQVDGYDYLTTSATGFTPAFVGSSVVNSSGQKYIYYAHA